MSDAGTYSDRGDDYQRVIALKWLVHMIDDETIQSLEAQLTSLGPNKTAVTVDDIAVHYRDGRTLYLQCKKNQVDWREWRLSDVIMQEELLKAKQQLVSNPQGYVAFCSQSEFGLLQKLREYAQIRPDYDAFVAGASAKNSRTLKDVAATWNIDERGALAFWLRMEFHSTGKFEEIVEQATSRLRYIVNKANTATTLLLEYISSQSSKRVGITHRFTRQNILEYLGEHGILKSPVRTESEILQDFSRASAIGRQWIRDIGGKVIRRQALAQTIEHITQVAKTLLITDEPGSGKTCLLLDIADYVQSDQKLGLLFIKADGFAECRNMDELFARGLPDDIVGKVARLADFRHVIVIMDSLDVLSLNRANGALQLFLSMIDQLERIPNVTTVAACREFDRRYDHYLRAREWQHVIQIGPLNWDIEVVPYLMLWGIDSIAYSDVMKTMLCNPRKLKLYEELAHRGQASSFESEHALVQRYLEVVVLEEPLLGQPALKILRLAATKLLREHGQWLPTSSIEIPDTIRQKLLSSQVLVSGQQPATFGFAHQTLIEGLAIQNTIAEGKSLLDFLQEHPPLPTLRPVVRAFFFYLRAFQHSLFRKQVREVLANPDVAFHLKRLLVESLGEIQPDNEDWVLVRYLINQQPDLFKNFLWATKHDGWLEFLSHHWLPAIKQDHSLQMGQEFCAAIERWVKTRPALVIGLWKDAYFNAWVDHVWMQRRIPIALDQLTDWKVAGLYDLLTSFLDAELQEHDFLGRVLSRWVDANDAGDELLWSYITKDVSVPDITHYQLSGKLRCSLHTFSRESFLRDRMTLSTKLLDMVLTSIESWTRQMAGDSLEANEIYSGFLDSTSWELAHSSREHNHQDDMSILMHAVEASICSHAEKNSKWWQLHSNDLSTSPEAAVRYFVLLACTKYPLENIGIIAGLFVSPSMLQTRMDYELGLLITASYHLLETTTQETHQALILKMHSEESGEENLPMWAIKSICGYLDRIPACFLTQSSLQFLDSHLHRLPPLGRAPYIYSRSGWVGSPIDESVVLGFTDHGLLQLFEHYSSIGKTSSEEYQGRLIGGEDQISSVVREAASKDPLRFSSLLRSNWINIPFGFRESILNGIANHLRYRAGDLQQPQNWQALQLPDKAAVGSKLLDILESKMWFWFNSREASEAVIACAETITDTFEIERLVFLCINFSSADDPIKILRDDEEELIATAINSTRGKVAEAVIKLANRLLENDQELPELLIPLISRFSLDCSPAVRAILLLHLPYLQSRHNQVGWELFEQCLIDATPGLWKLTERCLYYGYQNHFPKISGYLERILEEAIPDAAVTWGRISCLSYLSGHITEDQLFFELKKTNLSEAWLGVAEVFTTNIHHLDTHDASERGLLRLLVEAPHERDLLNEYGHVFNVKSSKDMISMEFIKEYFNALAELEDRYDPHFFVAWLATLATQYPIKALSACECLTRFLDIKKSQMWHKEEISVLLTTLFREAEDSNDLNLINRVVAVQDSFFRNGAYGLEEWLKTAEK